MSERSEKPVRFTQHARETMAKRGASSEEVLQAIATASWEPARLGRLECSAELPYNRFWNNKWYATKQVRPVFKEEASAITVITVYVFYY